MSLVSPPSTTPNAPAMPPILSAVRATPLSLPKPRSLAARDGLRYERKIAKQLGRYLLDGHFAALEHNPWFSYRRDMAAAAYCVPDFIFLHTSPGGRPFLCVAEVKLTWIPDAAPKLREIYCPVATLVFRRPAFGFVICRNLTPDVMPPGTTVVHTLSEAIAAAPGDSDVILHWPEIGQLPW